MSLLEGPIPALVTPFTENGDVNVTLLQDLVEWQLAQQARGFFVAGSTGEGLLMTLRERQLVAETVVGQVRNRVPVVIQVGALATRDCVALAEGAEAAGADGVSALPPFYYTADEAGVTSHFTAIGAASRLPLYLYNFPQTTGVLVTADQFARLIEGLHERSPANLYVQHNRVRSGGDLLAHDRRSDQRDRLNSTGNVPQTIQLPIRWSQIHGLTAQHYSSLFQLVLELLDRQVTAIARNGFKLVERTAAEPQPTPGHLADRHSAGSHNRQYHQRGLIPNASS